MGVGVQAPLSKLRINSFLAHDDPTRNSGGRSWEQGVIRHPLQVTLMLTGSPYGETEPILILSQKLDLAPPAQGFVSFA